MSAAVILIHQRRIIERYLAADAHSPESAQTGHAVGCRENWIFRRLVRSGVLRTTDNASYYIDAEGLERLRVWDRRRRWIALTVLLVLGIGLAVLAAR